MDAGPVDQETRRCHGSIPFSGAGPNNATHQHPVRPLLAPYTEDARDEGPRMMSAGDAEEASMRDEEDHEEGRKPIFRKNPDAPSREEIREHMKTHIPFRNWCIHCVRGRSRNDAHRTGGEAGVVRSIRIWRSTTPT